MSFVRRVSKFLNATSGLDLSLRLAHGCAIILAELCRGEPYADTWLTMALQLSLGKPCLLFIWQLVQCADASRSQALSPIFLRH